ncbi:MAG: DUF4347 domain-containing protein, partial [Pseudanabaenaceae cyanobacterium]
MNISSVHTSGQSGNDGLANIAQSVTVALRHLVIIDSGIDDYHLLQPATGATVEIYVLHPHQDGIAQISGAIQGSKVHSLQILAHGSPGEIRLGNTRLNLAKLPNYATELQGWQVTEIALYACEVAADATGQDFVRQLAAVTGANVAASASKVGNSALGGSWDLAVQTGAVTTPLLIDPEAVANYQGILPQVVNFTNATETITIAANGTDTNVSSSAGGGTTTYTNTSDGLQINGGPAVNTFNVNGVGTGFNLDLILNGSGYSSGDVVNLNADPHSKNFTIDNVQAIELGVVSGSTAVTATGNVNWTTGGYIRSLNDSSVTTTTGSISLVSKGSVLSAANTRGISANSTTITSTDGTITLDGTSKGQGGLYNIGVDLVTNSKVQSVNGDISINGVGTDQTAGSTNYGVSIYNGTLIKSTGTAKVSIQGQGGTKGTDYNRGIGMQVSSIVESTGSGDINMNGTGGGTRSANQGVYIGATNIVRSTGTGTNAANINVVGQGSTTATGTNHEVFRIEGAGSLLTSVDGDIAVTGTGGSGTVLNIGVIVSTNGVISSTGTGTGAGKITLIGKGSTTATGNNNEGVRFEYGGSVASVDGAIAVTGTGGSGSYANMGVSWEYGNGSVFGTLKSTGTATIDITGTGGNGSGDYNIGIAMNGAHAITSANGNITLSGTANGSGRYNDGISLVNGSVISSTGTGASAATVTVTGQGSVGGTSDNSGVVVNGNGSNTR